MDSYSLAVLGAAHANADKAADICSSRVRYIGGHFALKEGTLCASAECAENISVLATYLC